MQLQASSGKPPTRSSADRSGSPWAAAPTPGGRGGDECEAPVLAWLPTVQELVDAQLEQRAAAPVAQQRKDRLGRRVIGADRALG